MNQCGRFRQLFVLLIIGVSSSPVMAQMLHFRKFTTADGLIQGTVFALKQDSIGRIWIGTSEGISVYDGQSFENISSRNGLKNEIVNCFFETRPGKMLIGTDGAGITLSIHPPGRPDTLIGTLTGERYLCQDSVNKIIRDSRGKMWFCTDGGATSWTFGRNNSISVHKYRKLQGLTDRQVTDVVKGPGGILWFSTVEGIFKYEDGRFQPMRRMNGPSRIIATCLCFDHNGTLWIGTQNRGIMSYRNHRIERYRWGSGRLLGRINAIIEDRNGILWFGTDRGLVRYDHKKTKLLDQHSGLTDNLVLCLLQDREGNIWIGTQSGLNLYLADGFASMSPNPGFISQMLRDPNGNLIAVGSGRVWKIKNYQLRALPLIKETGLSHIYRIYYPSPDSLWVITGSGLYYYEVSKKHLIRIRGRDRKPLRSVSTLVNDHNGLVWIGMNNGLAVLTKNGLVRIPFLSQVPKVPHRVQRLSEFPIPRNPLRNLLVDHRNRIWLGYWDAGLYMFDGEHLKYFDKKDGLTSHMIRCLFEDHSGNIWIATRDKGVFRYDGKTFQHFSKQNVLESNWVRSIVQDSHGRMWFGTAHGLTLFDGSKWKSYHSLPGLLIDDVNTIFPVSPDIVWFGTSNTLFSYNYSGETTSQIQANVYIKNVTQGKHHIGNLPLIPDLIHFREISRFVTRPIRHVKITPIPYSRNELSIEIAGIQYQNSSEVQYAYKLVGLDSTWSVPSPQTLVNYRNLPPGTYRFLAKTDIDGVWSVAPASLSFTILTPYWRKFWFISLVTFFAIVLVVTVTSLVDRYRYKQLLRIAKLRSDIASDLHDDIGSALSSISIYSELARREAKDNPEHAAHFSGRVENISRNLMDVMNDIIWSINPGNETLEDVILRMEEFAVNMLEAKGMEVYLTIPENSLDISLDLHSRRNVLLIFKEITNNTARHSGATQVHINMLITKQESSSKKFEHILRIVIKDNGRGFDPRLENGGNGLRNIRKRAEDIGGRINLVSETGKGTKTELSIPVKS